MTSVVYKVAAALLATWLGGVLFGRSGFWHILLLCAIAITVVQLTADRRATQK